MSIPRSDVCAQGGDLLDWTSDVGIQEDAFIQRIEALSTMGYSVMISNMQRYFECAAYLSTFTRESIVIALGVPSLQVMARACPPPPPPPPARGWCAFAVLTQDASHCFLSQLTEAAQSLKHDQRCFDLVLHPLHSSIPLRSLNASANSLCQTNGL